MSMRHFRNVLTFYFRNLLYGKHLGMDKDELLRLKQITGLAALFRDVNFGRAWEPVSEEEKKECDNPL